MSAVSVEIINYANEECMKISLLTITKKLTTALEALSNFVQSYWFLIGPPLAYWLYPESAPTTTSGLMLVSLN